MVEIGVEIEAGRLEMGSILINDTGISSGMIALVVHARGLGLNRRYRLVFISLKKTYHYLFFHCFKNPRELRKNCLIVIIPVIAAALRIHCSSYYSSQCPFIVVILLHQRTATITILGGSDFTAEKIEGKFITF